MMINDLKSNRRVLLKTGTLALLGGFPGMNPCLASSLFAEPVRDTLKSIPEKELLGMRQPPLFGKGFRLRKEAARAFQSMQQTASQEGIALYSISSYRSFDHQRGIWNRKYDRLQKKGLPAVAIIHQIIQYSSIPGTSRHHWGTDIDIIDASKPRPQDPLQARYFQHQGPYTALYDWLRNNAQRFGFYEVYTDHPSRTGFAYEPWHWSYASLSKPYLKQYAEINVHEYLSGTAIRGKKELSGDFMKEYFTLWGMGINPVLLPD